MVLKKGKGVYLEMTGRQSKPTGTKKEEEEKKTQKKKRNKKTLKAPCVFRNEGGPRIESRKMCLAPSRIQWGLKNYEVIAVTI